MSDRYLSNPNLKAIGTPIAFSNEQISEYQKCSVDIHYFIEHYVKIIHVDKGLVPFSLFDFQKEILNSFVSENKVIVKLPRQMGKCFSINTLVKIKHLTTGVTYELTVGELYDYARQGDLSILPNDCARFDVAYHQGSQDQSLRVCKEPSPPKSELSQGAIGENQGVQKSSVPTWRKTLSFFRQIYRNSKKRGNGQKTTYDQNQEWKQYWKLGILAQTNQWRRGSSKTTSEATPNHILSGNMYSKIWGRRWNEPVGAATKKVDPKLQKTKLFQGLTRFISSNYAKLFIPNRVFCGMAAGGYGELQKQGVSVDVKQSTDHFAGLHRLDNKEDHRIRWNLLAWPKEKQSNQRREQATSNHKFWVSDFASPRGGISKNTERNNRSMPLLSDGIKRKFIDSIPLQDFLIETDTGWQPISWIHQTIPYQEWTLHTNAHSLVCADTHIVFRANGNEVFVKDLVPGDSIQTQHGVERVLSVACGDQFSHMFDITVESNDHRFYTNGILSHNTTTTAAFFLWYILFHDNKVCAILANKATTAREILSRVKLGYEHLPLWLQQGVAEWNKGSITLENGSRVLAAATSSSGIRGYSLSLVFLDEFAHVQSTIADEFFTSIFPTISSGKDTKILIASTPNGMNHYYKFWVDAEEQRNGFKTLFFPWNSHPDRDHEWMEKQLQVLGDVKFRQEVLCVGGDTTITIRNKQTGQVESVSIEELYTRLETHQ